MPSWACLYVTTRARFPYRDCGQISAHAYFLFSPARFVGALMFLPLRRQKIQDPGDAAADTERAHGNLLNALLTFPVAYTFHVVGQTAGDADLQEQFARQVHDVVREATAASSSSGLADDDGETAVACHVTPRGTKYTKVTVRAQVASADVVALIYDQLARLELSVMQY